MPLLLPEERVGVTPPPFRVELLAVQETEGVVAGALSRVETREELEREFHDEGEEAEPEEFRELASAEESAVRAEGGAVAVGGGAVCGGAPDEPSSGSTAARLAAESATPGGEAETSGAAFGVASVWRATGTGSSSAAGASATASSSPGPRSRGPAQSHRISPRTTTAMPSPTDRTIMFARRVAA